MDGAVLNSLSAAPFSFRPPAICRLSSPSNAPAGVNLQLDFSPRKEISRMTAATRRRPRPRPVLHWPQLAQTEGGNCMITNDLMSESQPSGFVFSRRDARALLTRKTAAPCRPASTSGSRTTPEYNRRVRCLPETRASTAPLRRSFRGDAPVRTRILLPR